MLLSIITLAARETYVNKDECAIGAFSWPHLTCWKSLVVKRVGIPSPPPPPLPVLSHSCFLEKAHRPFTRRMSIASQPPPPRFYVCPVLTLNALFWSLPIRWKPHMASKAYVYRLTTPFFVSRSYFELLTPPIPPLFLWKPHIAFRVHFGTCYRLRLCMYICSVVFLACTCFLMEQGHIVCVLRIYITTFSPEYALPMLKKKTRRPRNYCRSPSQRYANPIYCSSYGVLLHTPPRR